MSEIIQRSPELDRESLLSLFDVDLSGGRLFWKQPPKEHARLLGIEAGGPQKYKNRKVYWLIGIGNRRYKRGRLIFCLANGYMPTPCVDHRNGNSLDDRPENLREATLIQNAWNHQKRKRRIILPMGVRTTGSGRYQARIGYYGKQIHLGSFDTPIEAQLVYQMKRKELFGEYA